MAIMDSESNDTSYNYFEKLMRSEGWKKFEISWWVVTSLIALCIVIGNLTTVLVIATHRKLRCRKNALVGSLAVSDLCVGIHHTIYMTMYYLSKPTKQWNIGLVLLVTNFSVSLLHIIFIGLERYIAIVKPLHYASLVSGRVTLAMVIVCWAVPFVTLFPTYIVIMKDSQISNGLYFGNRIHFIVIMASYIILSIAMSVFYTKIYIISREHTKNIRQFRLDFPSEDSFAVRVCGTSTSTSMNMRNDPKRHKPPVLKGSKLVLAIKSSYLIMCLPIAVYASLMTFGLTPTISTSVFEVIAQDFALTNSAINILLYAMVITDFRDALKSMLSGIGNVCNHIDNDV